MIVTRFAPSPTGNMHLGNARTALFNYIFTKSVGGKLLLRIEDTDKERSTEESIKSIYDNLDWLGITFDGNPVLQSNNIDRHKEIANILLNKGLAYKCYCSSEELSEMREEALKNNLPPKYNRMWRDRIATEEESKKPYVIRIKAPLDGETIINDSIKGEVKRKNSELDDMILIRSDGTPVYQLAVVVDDYDMGVNYIIRGDDHLTNTFRQIMIYNAMGWDIPSYAHLSMMLGPNGEKLSKRHGASSVGDIKDHGILSEALNNYMVRLGFSEGEEILSIEEIIKIFDITKVNKSAAMFDIKKLENINMHYLHNKDNKDILELIKPDLAKKGFGWNLLSVLNKMLPSLKERTNNLNQLVLDSLFIDKRLFLSSDGTTYNYSNESLKFIEKNKDDMIKVMNYLYSIDYDNFDIKLIAEKLSIKPRTVGQTIRIALSFSTMSPPVDVMIDCLGIDETILRLFNLLNFFMKEK